MHRLLPILGFSTLVYTILNINTQSYSISHGWNVDWGYLLLQLLYWPAVVVAWLCAIASLVFLREKRTRIVAFVSLLLVGPMVGYSLYYPEFSTLKKWHHEQALKERWFQSAQMLNHLLFKFLQDHPEAISWPGKDEQIDGEPFRKYLSQQGSLRYSAFGRRYSIDVTNKEVLTPWGDPVLFGVDRDGDGYISFAGKRGSLKAGHANPWADGGFYYKAGVGVLPTGIPEEIFDPGATYMTTLNDNEFRRLYEYRENELKTGR